MFYTRLAAFSAGFMLVGAALIGVTGLITGVGKSVELGLAGVFWAVVLGVLSEISENVYAHAEIIKSVKRDGPTPKETKTDE